MIAMTSVIVSVTAAAVVFSSGLLLSIFWMYPLLDLSKP